VDQNAGLPPLEELKRLNEQVDQVSDLNGLKPIYYRLEQIAKDYPGDFEVQLALSDIKQHLVQRGMKLKEAGAGTSQQMVSLQTPIAMPPGAGQTPSGQMAAAPPPVTPSPGSGEHGIARTPSGQMPAAPPPPPPPAYVPAAGGRAPLNWKRALWIGGVLGSVLSIAGIALLIQLARKRNIEAPPPEAGQVAVEIITTPPGARIRINNEERCTSNCKLNLAPGNYQVTAFLDGYDPAASGVTVAPGSPISVNLNLEPQAQTLRVLTDLESGKVTINDQPAPDLQEGQFILDRIPPGKHTVKILGKGAEASFTFEAAPAKLPVITGPIITKNLMALGISSFGSTAKAVSNAGPWKLALNGQVQGDASPAGIDLQGFAPGVHEISVGEGKDQKVMKENFGPAPALTVFLKSDLDVGTLIVFAGQDDVTVYLNDREFRRKTARGQVRMQLSPGKITVRVAREGFQTETPPQTVEIKKGEETRIEFKLRPLPQISSLVLRGFPAGTQVVIDDKAAGTVGPDGNFTAGGIAPGEHAVQLRRDNAVSQVLRRMFKAGETVTLGNTDLTLVATSGTIRLTKNPPETAVSWRKPNETQTHEIRGNSVELLPGTYVLSAKANGYNDRDETVTLSGGEVKTVDLALTRATSASKPVELAVRPGTIADFEQPFVKDGEEYVKKGGGINLFKLPAKGVFTFTVELVKGGGVFRGGRVRWVVDYQDPQNYAFFEVDKKNFWAKDRVNGRNSDRDKTEHGLADAKSFTVQIEITPDRVVHRIRSGDQWVPVDSWSQPGRNFTDGKFGFLVQGNDEIAIRDFRFTPR
jgi:hypothetical protein